MNTPPDSRQLQQDRQFLADLEAERRLETAAATPRDAELAADWRLRRELSGLANAELPARLRRRVLPMPRQHRRFWAAALAAGLTAAAVIVGLQRGPDGLPEAPPSTITAAELAELQLALTTLNEAGRRTARITGREVSDHLALPPLGLAELPYARLMVSLLEVPRQPFTKEQLQ